MVYKISKGFNISHLAFRFPSENLGSKKFVSKSCCSCWLTYVLLINRPRHDYQFFFKTKFEGLSFKLLSFSFCLEEKTLPKRNKISCLRVQSVFDETFLQAVVSRGNWEEEEETELVHSEAATLDKTISRIQRS